MINRRLTQLVRYTKQFCINNPSLRQTSLRQTREISVALNKNTYISKVKEMLDDPDTYTKVIKSLSIFSQKKFTKYYHIGKIKTIFQIVLIRKYHV